MRFFGRRLGDVEEIAFYGDGITATNVERASDNQCRATLTIASDCRPGLHALRVRTKTGISNLRVFEVGTMPETNEAEPNNTLEQPQQIELNHAINGVAENEDVDYYAFNATAGERITAELHGMRLGESLFDPFLAIVDARGFELASCDDAALLRQDPLVSVVIPEDGTYLIQVRESAYRGNGSCRYRLHVGTFVRPTAVLPAGGRSSQTISATLLGDPAGPTQREITLPDANVRTTATGDWFDDGSAGLTIEDEHGPAPSPNWFRLSDLDNTLETEPNNNHQQATDFTAPAALNGVIETEGDRDCYYFAAKKDQVFDIQVYARRLRSPLDPVLHVHKRGANYIGGNDDQNGPDSQYRFTAPEDGEYVVTVFDHLRAGGPDYVYRVEITPPTPRVSVQGTRQEQAVAVPRGGRTSMMLNAQRQDFGGPLTLTAAELPPGVTMHVAEVDERVGAIPIVFEAAADAASGTSMADLTIAHSNSEPGITGGFRQDCELVLGRNRVVFRAHTVDRMPVAIIDEAPFAIEAAVPNAPLVRDGQMQLKVTATRAEGFAQPIRLRVPFTPPGVGAQSGMQIPPDQAEATITINANGNAPLREWHLVVVADAPVPGGGRLEVSSQLVAITVVQPFVALQPQATSVEQGQQTTMHIAVQKNTEFVGEATLELRGLPHNATAEPVTIAPESEAVQFTIHTKEDSPPGRHRNVFCIATFTKDGEPVLHRLPAGELRIDKPLPAPAAAPAEPAPPPEPQAQTAPPERPLTRLEKLRQEHAARRRAELLQAQQANDDAAKEETTSGEAPPAESTPPGGATSTPGTRLSPRLPSREQSLLAAVVASTPADDDSNDNSSSPASRIDASTIESIAAYPAEISLQSSDDSQRIVLVATTTAGVTVDVTDQATITVTDETIIRINGSAVLPRTDGSTTINASHAGHEISIPVTVVGATMPRPTSFRLDIVPILTAAGCNSGACHGSARGQDGFRMSLFGFDPAGDWYRITREYPGRRINYAFPRESLLLNKATGSVPHTGMKRFEKDSVFYSTLLQWIEARTPDDPADVATVTGIELMPPAGVVTAGGQTMPMLVRATYSDGTTRDVTDLAVFRTNNDVSLKVESGGTLTSGRPGEAFITASFDTYTVGSPFVVLADASTFVLEDPAAAAPGNYIDDHIETKLTKLRMQPSGLCTDGEFLRRVYLDIIGLLPSPDERERFVSDDDPNKRAKLIDTLLERREFADIWVMQWAELLQIRSNNQQISEKAALLYFEWVRNAIAENVPVDEMVRRILTSTGGSFTEPATNFYLNQNDTLILMENVAQAFMGIRVQCAQCHNHPFDRWTQDDYYGFAAFFPQVGRKRGEDPRETIVFNTNRGEVNHPVGNRQMTPKFLGGEAQEIARGTDRREVVAEWLTSKENPYFARSLANRVWAHFMGVGIVEPVDDFRVSNPPANGPLLDALAAKLKEYDYDFKRLVRDICNSRAYQRSTIRNATNANDERNFSHALVRRLRAEVLLDIISQVTSTPQKYQGLPLGARAVEIADGTTSNYFLNTFGRATRDTVCACEVSREPALGQALHLINGDTVNQKIKQGNLIGSALEAGQTPEQIITDLYQRCLNRTPLPEERAAIMADLEDIEDPKPILEDFFWALLNSREFIFNH